jgi:hypothetical protein
MFKSLVVIGALAVAAPSLALAQGNLNNTPASQNANGLSSVSQKKDSPVAVAKSTLRLLLVRFRRLRNHYAAYPLV